MVLEQERLQEPDQFKVKIKRQEIIAVLDQDLLREPILKVLEPVEPTILQRELVTILQELLQKDLQVQDQVLQIIEADNLHSIYL